MSLAAGTKAPDFKAPIEGGGEISFKDFKGKWLVLYFYPKDNTSGCTAEACSFRDSMGRLASLGAAVVGVSPDSVKSHDNFKEKFQLNFNLVSDPDKKICTDYDIIGEKSLYGKKYIGIIRSTYIIDGKGIIRYVFSNVKVDGHTDEVMAKLRELQLSL